MERRSRYPKKRQLSRVHSQVLAEWCEENGVDLRHIKSVKPTRMLTYENSRGHFVRKFLTRTGLTIRIVYVRS